MNAIRIMLKYLRDYKRLVILILATILLASVFEGASLGLLIPLIGTMTGSVGSAGLGIPFIDTIVPVGDLLKHDNPVFIVFLILFIIVAVKNVFIYFSNVLIARLRFSLIEDLNAKLMARLLSYDVRFFDGAKTGHIITSMSYETVRMGEFMLLGLSFAALAARVMAYIVILLMISFKFSLAVFFMIALVLLPMELIINKLRKIGAEISRHVAEYNFKLTEIIGGIRLIKVAVQEAREEKHFRSVTTMAYDKQYLSNLYINLLMPLSETLIMGAIMILLAVLVFFVKVNIQSNFPFIAVYLVVLIRGLGQLNALNGMRSKAVNNIAAFGSYESVYDEGGKRTITSGNRRISGFSRSIEIKDAWFGYDKDKPVLKGVNVYIPKGSTTAIVGPSGAGKSTLINMIMRFYDLDGGDLTIDGISIRELDLNAWRRSIGLVSQDVFIFNATVRDNIAYGRPGASHDDVVEAASSAGAHEFISALPCGYDTVLGERGVRLSGGQKQRISIARAIISDPRILILDEATSSLDSETERCIKEAVERLARDRTVIAIAHRLSTVSGADSIVVIDGGTVIDNGRHEDLVKRCVIYRQLCNTQFITANPVSTQ